MAGLYKRNGNYYIKYYVGSQIIRKSLQTKSAQIAKEKLRQFESAKAQGNSNPLPTKTPLADIIAKYVRYMRATKTAKSAQTDIYYLRAAFGPICPELEDTRKKQTTAKPKKKKKVKNARPISANSFEEVTTAQISEFISERVRLNGIAPKTANRYREIICRLYNWSMNEGGIKMPNDKNPAAKVSKYKLKASEISFLSLDQITKQLDAFKNNPQLQTMVAMLIYAGLRREELLWLTRQDVNLKKGIISIRAKTINGEYWEPKTKVNRAVPISKALREYLSNYTPKPSIGGWYFPSPKGLHYDPDNFSRDLRIANNEAKLKWTCLDYRHTFGSQLAMKGESLYKISKLMGNSPEICRKHYAAIIPESLMDCVDFGNDHTDIKCTG